MRSARSTPLVLGAVLLLSTAACGSDDDGGDAASTSSIAEATMSTTAPPTTAPPTTAPPTTTETTGTTAPATTAPEATAPATSAPATTQPARPLTILLTNDDGVDAGGIDAVAQALSGLDDVDVTIVAPATNQSGSSNKVSDPAPDTAAETTTVSGLDALAVDGTPSDAVNYALDNVFDAPPDLVVSGSNDGQNIGPFTPQSGTVGAARTAGTNGIPALAVSMGLVADGEPDFSVVTPYVVEWVESNREVVLGFDGEIAPVWSLNVPSCGDTGTVRGLIEGLPIAPEQIEGVDVFSPDCSSSLEDPDNDVIAFANGFATLSEIPEQMVTAPPESAGDVAVDPDSAATITAEASSSVAADTTVTFTVSGEEFGSDTAFVLPGPAPDPCVAGPIASADIDTSLLDTAQVTTVEVAGDGTFSVDVTYDVDGTGLVIAAATAGGTDLAAVTICVE